MSDQTTPVDIPTDADVKGAVAKAEITHRNKDVAVRVFYMKIAWAKWYYFAGLGLISALIVLVGVAAANIPSFTEANQTLTNTMATMHPWNTQSYPSWSVVEEATSDPANPNVYLRTEFVMTAFMQRIFDLGWINVGTDIMARVRVPNATEGEADIRYYSPWIAHSTRVVAPTPPAEGEQLDRTYALRFSDHNLPPIGPPDGALTDGASYQFEIRLLMSNPDGTFFREYAITTDWFDYVQAP